MDSSTSEDCKRIEEEVGGAQVVAAISGSRAYERFTGPQISKFVRTARDVFSKTERISLISSLIPSLFLGDYAPIDASDAGGMNLYDLNEMRWSPTLLAATVGGGEAQELRVKLGEVVLSHTVCGTVHPYFSSRFGFHPSCQVVCGTGDNPSSAVGLQLAHEGDVAISLGTSDTLLAIVPKKNIKPGLEGHFFTNPVDPETCLVMLCWKNGSVTRERVRVSTGVADWERANELMLTTTKAGNGGYMGLYILEPEITPHVLTTQIARFGPNDERLAEFASAAMELRAVWESQMLSMRTHSVKLGLQQPKRILVTGGASVNPVVRQLLADVFACPVFVAASGPNSAALGAAFRALHGHRCSQSRGLVDLATLVASQHQLAAEPQVDVVSQYASLYARYSKLESLLAS